MTTLAKVKAVVGGVTAMMLTIFFPGIASSETSVSSKIQRYFYPRERVGVSAQKSDLRGWTKVEYDKALQNNLSLRSDIVVYLLDDQKGAFVDGEAGIVLHYPNIEVAAGLLRESWGRLENSPLEILGSPNTLFSLVDPELSLGQPVIKSTFFSDGTAVVLYGLIGQRDQPVPETHRRFSFGVPTDHLVETDKEGALAFRISDARPSFDWSVHLFNGLSPRPTFVTRFTPSKGLSVDAIYHDIFQVGGDVETTISDWRLVAEGFSRQGAVNAEGTKQPYHYFASLTEYQRFGVFNSSMDIIARFEVTSDTRKDKADIPFASSVRMGVRLMETHVKPMEVQLAYLYDWSLSGHGLMTSVEKRIDSPHSWTFGLGLTLFSSDSDQPNVLDVWERDFELSGSVKVEI